MLFLMLLSGVGGGAAGIKVTRYYQKRKGAAPGRRPHSYRKCRKRRCWQPTCKAYNEGFDLGRRTCPRKHAPGA